MESEHDLLQLDEYKTTYPIKTSYNNKYTPSYYHLQRTMKQKPYVDMSFSHSTRHAYKMIHITIILHIYAVFTVKNFDKNFSQNRKTEDNEKGFIA